MDQTNQTIILAGILMLSKKQIKKLKLNLKKKWIHLQYSYSRIEKSVATFVYRENKRCFKKFARKTKKFFETK